MCSKGRVLHILRAYLSGRDHGTEGEDGGTVFDCGLIVKRSLSVQYQNGHLKRKRERERDHGTDTVKEKTLAIHVATNNQISLFYQNQQLLN